MGKCAKCGRLESSAVPLGWVQGPWAFHEVCRYGCKNGNGSPREIAFCHSCKKPVIKVDAGHCPLLCSYCYAGQPADNLLEKLSCYTLALSAVQVPEIGRRADNLGDRDYVRAYPEYAAPEYDPKAHARDHLVVQIDTTKSTVKILKQRSIGAEFGREGDAPELNAVWTASWFKARNGIYIFSRLYPAWETTLGPTLCVRGSHERDDKNEFEVPRERLDDIAAAVQEYNEWAIQRYKANLLGA